MNDNQLINDILNGKIEAFNKLMLKYEQSLLIFIKKLTSFNDNMSLDIFQEVWLKVYKNLHKYNFKNSFKTWLYTIAINETKNYYKKNHRHLNRTVHIDSKILNNIKSSFNVESEYIKKELMEHLLKIINILKPKYQIIIRLRFFENLKFREIAKLLNESERNIKYKIEKAKKIIKSKLNKIGYTNIE